MEHKRRNKKVAENAHSGQMFFLLSIKSLARSSSNQWTGMVTVINKFFNI
jgi:hypothetical protein